MMISESGYFLGGHPVYERHGGPQSRQRLESCRSVICRPLGPLCHSEAATTKQFLSDCVISVTRRRQTCPRQTAKSSTNAIHFWVRIIGLLLGARAGGRCTHWAGIVSATGRTDGRGLSGADTRLITTGCDTTRLDKTVVRHQTIGRLHSRDEHRAVSHCHQKTAPHRLCGASYVRCDTRIAALRTMQDIILLLAYFSLYFSVLWLLLRIGMYIFLLPNIF